MGVGCSPVLAAAVWPQLSDTLILAVGRSGPGSMNCYHGACYAMIRLILFDPLHPPRVSNSKYMLDVGQILLPDTHPFPSLHIPSPVI
jgi:hypothetical protein